MRSREFGFSLRPPARLVSFFQILGDSFNGSNNNNQYDDDHVVSPDQYCAVGDLNYPPPSRSTPNFTQVYPNRPLRKSESHYGSPKNGWIIKEFFFYIKYSDWKYPFILRLNDWRETKFIANVWLEILSFAIFFRWNFIFSRFQRRYLFLICLAFPILAFRSEYSVLSKNFSDIIGFSEALQLIRKENYPWGWILFSACLTSIHPNGIDLPSVLSRTDLEYFLSIDS